MSKEATTQNLRAFKAPVVVPPEAPAPVQLPRNLKPLEPPKEELGAYGVPAHWKNVAVSLRRLGRGQEISVHVDGTGFARKKTPCEGFEVTLQDGSSHFIPAALLLGAR